MAQITVQLDTDTYNALLMSTQSRVKRKPTNAELWEEVLGLLQRSGPPPEVYPLPDHEPYVTWGYTILVT